MPPGTRPPAIAASAIRGRGGHQKRANGAPWWPALVAARVVGERRHPALVERFTALEGELTVKRDGQKSVLREGETAVIEPGVWHDWWNASGRDARVRVEVTPGERFAHMIRPSSGLHGSDTRTSRGWSFWPRRVPGTV
jgi:mannose-6-phosphate isomerase-like protein (cupin superfamily)